MTKPMLQPSFVAGPLDDAAEADAMVTVFGILNLTEDSFFDESRRLDPAGAVTAAIERTHQPPRSKERFARR